MRKQLLQTTILVKFFIRAKELSIYTRELSIYVRLVLFLGGDFIRNERNKIKLSARMLSCSRHLNGTMTPSNSFRQNYCVHIFILLIFVR